MPLYIRALPPGPPDHCRTLQSFDLTSISHVSVISLPNTAGNVERDHDTKKEENKNIIIQELRAMYTRRFRVEIKFLNNS